jgi:O-antigen ligase
MAPPVILESPLFGHGPGRGAEALGFITPGGLVTIDTYVLSVVLDYGVIGFVLFFGMLFAAIILTFRLAINFKPGPGAEQREASFVLPFCAMLAAFFMIKTVLSQEENHAILFMVYGAVIVLAYRARGSQIRPPLKTHLVGRG